jgi:hypothetical protein
MCVVRIKIRHGKEASYISMDASKAAVSHTENGPNAISALSSQTDAVIQLPVSPYDFNIKRSSDVSDKVVEAVSPVNLALKMHNVNPKRSHNPVKCVQSLSASKKRSVISTSLPASKSQSKFTLDPTQDFEKEELKLLSIVRSQQSTVDAFAAMNSYTDGDSIISLRELSSWLPIQFPRFNNTTALKLAIKSATRLHVLDESRAGSKDILLAKMRPPKEDDRKVVLELDELPSFFENLLAYNRISKFVASIDPTGELKLSKLEVFLFLQAIKVSSKSEVGKGLVEKVNNFGSVSFPELCRISFDLGFTSFEIRNARNQLARVWNFCIEKPEPEAPPMRRIKLHEEVQSEMRSKIVFQTRLQDAMSSSIMPYMVKSRLRAIKNRCHNSSKLAELSSSSISTMGSAGIAPSRPTSAGHISALWKTGNTPRETISQKAPLSTNNASSIMSRTQRSFEQGSVLDIRRLNPLYIDTQNGQTIYDMPVLSSREYMDHCPIRQEVFKRIVDQQEINPFAFTTSRTPRLYGVHTSTPGIVRREFDCSSRTESFFHNADINIRRQYRPCTAERLETGKSNAARKQNSPKPNWCYGAVSWNGKSTDLPKYSGDIGFFETNQFKKRFETDTHSVQMWLEPAHNGNLLNTTKIKPAKLNIT